VRRRYSTRYGARRFVRDLGLPPTDNVRDLLPVIEERSGCPIRLAPAPAPAPASAGSEQGLCGMWVRTVGGIDYIFVHEKTSRAHQDHIIAHELAHILRDHGGSSALPPTKPLTDRLLTTLDPAVVRMMLGRTDYEYEDEREAELIGSYLQRQVHRAGRRIGGHDRMAETLLRIRR
jgi:hypothetical protein